MFSFELEKHLKGTHAAKLQRNSSVGRLAFPWDLQLLPHCTCKEKLKCCKLITNGCVGFMKTNRQNSEINQMT